MQSERNGQNFSEHDYLGAPKGQAQDHHMYQTALMESGEAPRSGFHGSSSVRNAALPIFSGLLVLRNYGQFGSVEIAATVRLLSLKMAIWQGYFRKSMQRKLLSNRILVLPVSFGSNPESRQTVSFVTCVYSIVACLRFKSASVRPNRCINSTMRLSRKTIELFSKMLPSGVKGSRSPIICRAM